HPVVPEIIASILVLGGVLFINKTLNNSTRTLHN
ncbi:unnamed protein product, partial [marine sediment metagenome]